MNIDNVNQSVTTGVSSTTSSTSSNCIVNDNATTNVSSIPSATSNGNVIRLLLMLLYSVHVFVLNRIASFLYVTLRYKICFPVTIVSAVNMYNALLCVDVEFCAPIWQHGLDFVEPAMHLSLEERN